MLKSLSLLFCLYTSERTPVRKQCPSFHTEGLRKGKIFQVTVLNVNIINFVRNFCVGILLFNPSAWNDDHCSSCCMLSLIRLYLNDIVSKCNQAASCLFVKELALLWCGRQLLEIISSFFFSALEVWVFFLQSLISQTVLCIPLTAK